MGCRLPEDAQDDPGNWVQNTLHFDDGGMRGLACAVVWTGLIHHSMTMPDADLVTPPMAELARQLLSIPTFQKSQAGDGDEASAMIRRIIKQNVDAKKQAVSSYEWSQILKNIASNSKKSKVLSLQEAIELYNCNPEVAAHGGGKVHTV